MLSTDQNEYMCLLVSLSSPRLSQPEGSDKEYQIGEGEAKIADSTFGKDQGWLDASRRHLPIAKNMDDLYIYMFYITLY